MSVSIAMAAYNGARHIQEQLDSFAAQTRPPDELVICDDGSDDGTCEIVEAFAARAPFTVRLERNVSRLGVAGNFDKALSLCTGNIVFLSDQDDVWFPQKIEHVLRVFANSPGAMIVINDQIIADADLRHQGVTKSGNVRRLGLPIDNFITGCCTAVRSEFLPIAVPTPPGCAHDTWLHLLGNLLGARCVLDEPLQLYRRHGRNASHALASNTSRVGTLTLVREHGFKPAAWDSTLSVQRAARSRLQDRGDTLANLRLADRAKRAMERIAGKAEAIDRRSRILRKPRLNRLPYILSFLVSGGYRHFSGGRSALKDLVRP